MAGQDPNSCNPPLVGGCRLKAPQGPMVSTWYQIRRGLEIPFTARPGREKKEVVAGRQKWYASLAWNLLPWHSWIRSWAVLGVDRYSLVVTLPYGRSIRPNPSTLPINATTMGYHATRVSGHRLPESGGKGGKRVSRGVFLPFWSQRADVRIPTVQVSWARFQTPRSTASPASKGRAS